MLHFRNLTLYRLSEATCAVLRWLGDTLGEKLLAAALRPVGPSELSTSGFVPPGHDYNGAMVERGGDYLLFTIGTEEKLLPPSVVAAAVARHVAAREAELGRPIGGRERRRIREEVLFTMLPQAFVKPSRVNAYIDTKRGWVVVDTASRKVAEHVLTLLRQALESLPAVPPDPAESVKAVMTEWVLHGASGDIELGTMVHMRDPVDGGAVIRCEGVAPDDDEITEHLKSGKWVTRLGLTFGTLAFTLCDDLSVRRLRYLDTHPEPEDDAATDWLPQQLQVMGDTYGALLDSLERLFGIARPGRVN